MERMTRKYAAVCIMRDELIKHNFALKNGMKTLDQKLNEKIWEAERYIDTLNSDNENLAREIENLYAEIENDQEEYQEEYKEMEKTLAEYGAWEERFNKLFNKVYGNIKGTEKQKVLNEYMEVE